MEVRLGVLIGWEEAYLGEGEAHKFAGGADVVVTASEDGEQ